MSWRLVGVLNHFGTVSAIVGVWFGAMCVSGVGDPLPKRQTIGICKTCRAAKLYQRPLNSMRSLCVLK